MRITIDGTDADIRIEEERTLGDVLAALDTWLGSCGRRICGIGVDGRELGASAVTECFRREVVSVETLALRTGSVFELLAECLHEALAALDDYRAADFRERESLAVKWEDGPAAGMLAEQRPELSLRMRETLRGGGQGPESLAGELRLHLAELADPVGQLEEAGPEVRKLADRLEAFPLDVQTGRRERAAETVAAFSSMAGKVLRIAGILKGYGVPGNEGRIRETEEREGEFHLCLTRMLDAFARGDMVLAGDLAEYDLAPKLRALHVGVLELGKGAVQ